MTPLPGKKAEDSRLDRGPHVSCLFALYPLGTDGHMETIYRAIDRAKNDGRVTVTPVHFATRLDGNLDDILQIIQDTFDEADAPHVVVHATISVKSPTKE
jgi:energy-coupling factor transport system substrate-specific component